MRTNVTVEEYSKLYWRTMAYEYKQHNVHIATLHWKYLSYKDLHSIAEGRVVQFKTHANVRKEIHYIYIHELQDICNNKCLHLF